MSGWVQVPPDSTGKKVDTSELTVGPNTVERQRVVVGDPTTSANLAVVTAAGALRVDNSAAGGTQYNETAVVSAGTAVGTMLIARTSALPGPITTLAAESNGSLHAMLFGSSGAALAVTAANALKVDGTGVTQPVSLATQPLPTGASTAAKQPALGTAGTPSADVITVQGAAAMTALKVDGSAVTQPISGTVTAQTADGSGNALTSTGNALDVNVKSGQTKGAGMIDANTLRVTEGNGATLNTGQVAVSTTVVQILPSNANRLRLVIANMGTAPIYIGPFNVSVSNGMVLAGIVGYPLTLHKYAGAIYAIAQLPATLCYMEEAI